MTITGTEQPRADRGALTLHAARAGAARISSILAQGGVETGSKSGGHDLVTTADRGSEAAIIEHIRRAYPDDAVLGEESGTHPGTSGYRWLVDPLDGTANFVSGRSDHAVSVAVESHGRVSAGAIVRPADGRWAFAANGELRVGQDRRSSTLGDGARSVTGAVNLHARAADALVCLGLPYAMTGRQRVFEIVREIIPQLRGIRVIGSAACDFLAMAYGECDAFIGFGLAEWDTAAGEAIVAAGGGSMRTVDTDSFPILTAAAPRLADELVDIVAAALIALPPRQSMT
jgi:myo-inositol-1(or 4)-monophosphatase